MLRRAVVALGVVLFAAVVGAQTLDEVLNKNYEARGGLEKLKAIQSAKITGTITMGEGMEAPLTWYWKRPNKLRSEFTFQGMTGISAYDGTTGWMVMPFMGKTEPEKMPDDQVKAIAAQADFEGPLVDWKAKGNKVELLGKDKIEGTDVYKLKVTRPDGDVTTMYLDADAGLEIKQEGKRNVRGQELEIESSIGDYKNVNGIMIPFSISSKAKGMPGEQMVTFSKVELDVPIDDTLFAMPAPKAAPAPAK
jgi:outer membrane lipoprotein-sorting protein